MRRHLLDTMQFLSVFLLIAAWIALISWVAPRTPAEPLQGPSWVVLE